MKTSLKIALIMLAAGVLFMVGGTALGARKHIYLENGLVRVAGSAHETRVSEILEPFSDVDIDIFSSDIELTATDGDFKIEFLNDGRFTFESGETLKIRENKGFGRNLININLLFFKGRDSRLKVYIPKNTELDSMEINNRSGDVFLRDFAASNIRIKNISGDIDLVSIKSKDIEVELVSGDFEAAGINADNCKMKLISGNIEMSGVEIKKLYAKNTSGDIEISGSLTDGEFDLISGDIDLKLPGKYEDYSVDIRNRVGNLYIDGKKSQNFKNEVKRAKKSIKADIVSGDVRFNFED